MKTSVLSALMILIAQKVMNSKLNVTLKSENVPFASVMMIAMEISSASKKNADNADMMILTTQTEIVIMGRNVLTMFAQNALLTKIALNKMDINAQLAHVFNMEQDRKLYRTQKS